tara:strand:- start:46 stop:342 length:297 start_codon:yes stop_codon:yes gene_type:complete
MSAYKTAISWLAKTLSRRKPRKIASKRRQPRLNVVDYETIPRGFQQKSYPFTVHYTPPKPKIKPPVKQKTVTGKQLKIPGMKAGGSSLVRVNGNWKRK